MAPRKTQYVLSLTKSLSVQHLSAVRKKMQKTDTSQEIVYVVSKDEWMGHSTHYYLDSVKCFALPFVFAV